MFLIWPIFILQKLGNGYATRISTGFWVEEGPKLHIRESWKKDRNKDGPNERLSNKQIGLLQFPHLHRKKQVCCSLFCLHVSYNCFFFTAKKGKSIVLGKKIVFLHFLRKFQISHLRFHLTQLTGGHEVETKRMAPRAGDREAGWCRRWRDGWDG